MQHAIGATFDKHTDNVEEGKWEAEVERRCIQAWNEWNTAKSLTKLFHTLQNVHWMMLETNGDNSFNVPHERDIHEDDNTLLLPLEQQLVCPEHEQPDTDEAHVHQAQTPQEQEVDEQGGHEQCHVTSREAEVEPAAASTVLASLDLFTHEQQHSGIDANELLIERQHSTLKQLWLRQCKNKKQVLHKKATGAKRAAS